MNKGCSQCVENGFVNIQLYFVAIVNMAMFSIKKGKALFSDECKPHRGHKSAHRFLYNGLNLLSLRCGLFGIAYLLMSAQVVSAQAMANTQTSFPVSSTPETCFHISTIEYVTPTGELVIPSWQRYAKALPIVLPACFSVTDLNALLPVATAQMINDGWVTARFGIANQDLSTGTLKLTLVVGVFDEVMVPEALPTKRWRPGLTLKRQDPINLRDIEQAVEQLNRLPSQKADIKVAPSPQQGMSNLVLNMQDQGPLVRGTLGYSQNESNTTTATLAWDRPLGSTDQLNLSLAYETLDTLQNYTLNANWSVGFGYNTVNISSRNQRSNRTITGAVEAFESETQSDGWQLDYTRRLYRNNDTLIDLVMSFVRDSDRSYIDGTEIDVQARDQGWGQAALRLSTTSSRANWVITATQQKGMPNWWGDDDPQTLPAGRPTHRYDLIKLDVSRTQDWQVGKASRLVWSSSYSGQHSRHDLHGANLFSIGGRGSVRGFKSSLSSESGWFLRNKISRITQKDYLFEPYIAFDMGEVTGPSAQYLEGTQLVGWALGQKITYSAFNIEMELGLPKYGPSALIAVAEPTVYIAATGSF